MKSLKLATVTTLAIAASISAAHADMAVGLTGDKTLVMIDGSKPGVTKSMDVKGVDRLLGIDVRPSNKGLYGVTSAGTIVMIDLANGEAKQVSKLEKTLDGASMAIVDFNPAADKLRFMGMDGTNLRVDTDSGKVTTDGSLAFEATDGNAGKKPNVVAAAYTNSFGKPEKTAMYDIDATIGFIQQTKPNDGTLKTIGAFGIGAAQSYAFDVYTTADGANTAWLVADNTLHTVDLATGKATKVGAIGGVTGMIRDITVLPKS
ncbi:MAG: DUF4394 domain-containing protein [Hyphomicrobiaceae bacterium]|nr:DUF4394 domain-containing protein [Hyphomicrobiaceae bacterium]